MDGFLHSHLHAREQADAKHNLAEQHLLCGLSAPLQHERGAAASGAGAGVGRRGGALRLPRLPASPRPARPGAGDEKVVLSMCTHGVRRACRYAVTAARPVGLYTTQTSPASVCTTHNPLRSGGRHDGVGRVGLGPPVGFFPLFTLEFSQQKKKFSAEITMSTLPK